MLTAAFFVAVQKAGRTWMPIAWQMAEQNVAHLYLSKTGKQGPDIGTKYGPLTPGVQLSSRDALMHAPDTCSSRGTEGQDGCFLSLTEKWYKTYFSKSPLFLWAGHCGVVSKAAACNTGIPYGCWFVSRLLYF